MIYENLKKNQKIIKKVILPKISINFVDGAFVEITDCHIDDEYTIQMFNDGRLHYQSKLKKNMWSRSGIKYFVNWNIKIHNSKSKEIILDYNVNFENKRVYIAFDSSSIGDTLAWIPYVEEFRKKHNCEITVSTFHNYLFIEQYNNIQFVNPGQIVQNIYAMYKIGWYYENDQFKSSQNPKDFKLLPLQQTICDILGLEYTEIKPLLRQPNIQKQKKVGLGLHSTAQAKYWNNPGGWQRVVDYLKGIGYEVVIYSKENDGYMGNFHPKGATKFKGGSLQEVIDDLSTCDLFIGLGSGLSWLAWSCGLPVVLISGFSKPYSETVTDTYRVFNENVCNGCFNTHKLDAGDWNWCPVYKGTERQFECTKQITAEMVIDKINEALKVTSI